MLGIVNAFELELAKYAFWSPSIKEINRLPATLKNRLSDIKENFTKLKKRTEKCKEFAFNGAMDINWLSAANLTEDLGLQLDVHGRNLIVDNWIGTNDHKLYRICRDIHSTYHDGSTMKRLAVTREEEMEGFSYWPTVDSYARQIMLYRMNVGYGDMKHLLTRIDQAAKTIEHEIANICLSKYAET
jgi:hypothetical protein